MDLDSIHEIRISVIDHHSTSHQVQMPDPSRSSTTTRIQALHKDSQQYCYTAVLHDAGQQRHYLAEALQRFAFCSLHACLCVTALFFVSCTPILTVPPNTTLSHQLRPPSPLTLFPDKQHQPLISPPQVRSRKKTIDEQRARCPAPEIAVTSLRVSAWDRGVTHFQSRRCNPVCSDTDFDSISKT